METKLPAIPVLLAKEVIVNLLHPVNTVEEAVVFILPFATALRAPIEVVNGEGIERLRIVKGTFELSVYIEREEG